MIGTNKENQISALNESNITLAQSEHKLLLVAHLFPDELFERRTVRTLNLDHDLTFEP